MGPDSQLLTLLINASPPHPLQAPKKAKKRAEGANSNVFSMFEQTQIQEFKEVGAAVESYARMEIPTCQRGRSLVPRSPQGPSG